MLEQYDEYLKARVFFNSKHRKYIRMTHKLKRLTEFDVAAGDIIFDTNTERGKQNVKDVIDFLVNEDENAIDSFFLRYQHVVERRKVEKLKERVLNYGNSPNNS